MTIFVEQAEHLFTIRLLPTKESNTGNNIEKT